jgi:Haem-binding domain
MKIFSLKFRACGSDCRRSSALVIVAPIFAAMLISACSSAGDSAAVPHSTAAQPNSMAADPQVHEVLVNSCFDCHSDQGSGSWSAKFAPSYLFGAGKAREVLNFSDWSTLDSKQRGTAAAEVASAIDNGSMPPGDYDFFHPSAKLNDEQKKLVAQWASHLSAVPAH